MRGRSNPVYRRVMDIILSLDISVMCFTQSLDANGKIPIEASVYCEE